MSRKIFNLPDVGEGLIEAEVVVWKVNVGDVVELNQPLVDIETAKAVVELPSPFAGTVVTLHGNVGETIRVDSPLVTFEVGGDAESRSGDDTEFHPGGDAFAHNRDELDAIDRAPADTGHGYVHRTSLPGGAEGQKNSNSAVQLTQFESSTTFMPRATPLVRLLAKRNGFALDEITATGSDGSITRIDVERAVAARAEGARINAAFAPASNGLLTRIGGHQIKSWSAGEREERIPVAGVLRSMANSMVSSAFSAPHAAVWLQVDVSQTVELLEQLNLHSTFAGIRLSPLVVTALAVCDATRTFPGVNSVFDSTKQEVVVRRYLNLGIAADTPRGLIVPNIRDADQLGLRGMALALQDLVAKARNGKTSPSDMTGTTLTITNIGPFGMDGAAPILPPGTGAIVCIGQITPRPCVVDGAVVVRQVVEIVLSFDHRQIDGGLASRFLRHIGNYLSDPSVAMIAG